MPKDRLLELKSDRAEITRGLGNGRVAESSSTQSEGVKQKTKKSKKVKENQKTIDDIFKESQQVRSWLEAVEEETKHVKRLHSTILHSTRPDPETRDKLMNAMIKIKTLMLRVRSSLKVLEKHKTDDHLSAAETRMISVQHATLFKRFQMALVDYQTALAHHKDQTEHHIKTQLQIVIQTVTRRPAVLAGTDVRTQEELEALLDNEATQVFVDNYVHETQAMKLALQDAKLKHKEMLELENNIKELHDLFTGIAEMVHVQGEMINVIEYNVEQGTGQVSLGNQEMSQAYTSKKSARRRKLWCFILLLCIVGIILTYAALHAVISGAFSSS